MTRTRNRWFFGPQKIVVLIAALALALALPIVSAFASTAPSVVVSDYSSTYDGTG